MSATQRLATVDQVAAEFGVTTNTVANWVKSGIVAPIRVTKKTVRYDLDQIRADVRGLANRAETQDPVRIFADLVAADRAGDRTAHATAKKQLEQHGYFVGTVGRNALEGIETK